MPIVSDRNLKQDFAEIDTRKVLGAVAALPISTWSYIEQGPFVRHLGPMAQDFAGSFEVGEDDRHINTVVPVVLGWLRFRPFEKWCCSRMGALVLFTTR